MKFRPSKLLMLCIFCVITNITFAQKLKEHLYIYDSQNNSYKITTHNQPYAIFLNDTLVLKGYFDAVYPTDFLFATKDSVYLLTPNQVLDIHPIAGFNTNTSGNYSKAGNSLLKAGGIVVITIGALILPATIAALIFEPQSGLVFAAITGSLITGGILMTSHANKNIKNASGLTDTNYSQRNNRYRLYIIKSPI